MRALITRPRDDAERVATPLRERGVEVLLDPLLSIRFLPAPSRMPWARDQLISDLKKSQALVFTSANGVRAFAARSSDRSLPVYAVGDTTATLAKEVGFSKVDSAKGDINSLAALIRQLVDPKKGPLLHACGTKTAGDLGGLLAPGGYTVLSHALYEARPATVLIRSTLDAFKEDAIDVVLLFSPRTAEIFANLIRAADLAPAMRRVVAYALSPAVARALGDLPLQAVRIAAEPTQESLLALFDADCSGGVPVSASVPGMSDTSVFAPAQFIPGANVASASSSIGGDKQPDVAPSLSEPASPAGKASGPNPISAAESTVRPVTNSPFSSAGAASAPNAGDTSPITADTVNAPSLSASPSVSPSGSASSSVPPSGGVPPKRPGSQPSKAPVGKVPPSKATSPKASPPKTPNEPKPKKRGLGCGTMLLLLLFAAIALPGSWTWWRERVPESYRTAIPELPFKTEDPKVARLSDDLSKLSRDLKAANATIRSLNDELANVRKTAEDNKVIVDLSEPLNDNASAYLNTRIDELARTIATFDENRVTPKSVMSLTDRVTEVEVLARQTQEQRVRAASLVLAASQAREALDRGDAFDTQIKTIQVLAADNQEILATTRPLLSLAAAGIKPRATLRKEFVDAANAVARADAVSDDKDWLARTTGALKGVVVVRNLDPNVEQPEPLALTARADQLVRNNDLAGAYEVMNRLEGLTREAALPWIEQTRARLDAEALLNDLSTQVLTEYATAQSIGNAGASAPEPGRE